MAAFHTLSLPGLAFRRSAIPVVARTAYPRPRSLHIVATISMALWAAVGRALLYLWAFVALGFSLLVLIGLFFG